MSTNMVIEAAKRERLVNMGRKAEAVKRFGEIENRASALLIMIREQLDPTFELNQFNLENTMSLLKELRQLQLEAREIDEKIAEYNALIGLQD
jgi:hypothetical protein